MTGIPALEAIAAQEGPKAVKEFALVKERGLALVPAE